MYTDWVLIQSLLVCGKSLSLCYFFKDMISVACLCLWVCAHESRSPQKYQILPVLELQALVSCLTWGLGNELRSYVRATCTLNN